MNKRDDGKIRKKETAKIQKYCRQKTNYSSNAVKRTKHTLQELIRKLLMISGVGETEFKNREQTTNKDIQYMLERQV